MKIRLILIVLTVNSLSELLLEIVVVGKPCTNWHWHFHEDLRTFHYFTESIEWDFLSECYLLEFYLYLHFSSASSLVFRVHRYRAIFSGSDFYSRSCFPLHKSRFLKWFSYFREMFYSLPLADLSHHSSSSSARISTFFTYLLFLPSTVHFYVLSVPLKTNTRHLM